MLDGFDLSDATRRSTTEMAISFTCGWMTFLWDVSDPVDARAAKVNDEADSDRAISFGLNDANQFRRRSRKAIAVGWLLTNATCGRGTCSVDAHFRA